MIQVANLYSIIWISLGNKPGQEAVAKTHQVHLGVTKLYSLLWLPVKHKTIWHSVKTLFQISILLTDRVIYFCRACLIYYILE